MTMGRGRTIVVEGLRASTKRALANGSEEPLVLAEGEGLDLDLVEVHAVEESLGLKVPKDDVSLKFVKKMRRYAI